MAANHSPKASRRSSTLADRLSSAMQRHDQCRAAEYAHQGRRPAIVVAAGHHRSDQAEHDDQAGVAPDAGEHEHDALVAGDFADRTAPPTKPLHDFENVSTPVRNTSQPPANQEVE